MVPHITPSWLRHGTQVSYSGMTHSRIYATSYSHLAVYVPIIIRHVMGSTALTLWYHHISTFCLYYNGTLVWLNLTNTPLMYVFSLSSITCVLPASSSIHPYVSGISHNKLHPLIHSSLPVYCISYTPWPVKNGPPKQNAVKCTIYNTIQ